MKKRILALFFATVMLLGVMGCGTAEDAADATAQEVAEEEAAPVVDVDTADILFELASDPSEYRMFIQWPAPDTFFDSYVLEGVRAFERDYGISVSWDVGSDWTQDVQNQQVEAMAAMGYNLFSVFGADASGANALYLELRNSVDAIVIHYASRLDEPVQAYTILSSDIWANSTASTRRLIQLMGEEGTMILVLENLGDINTLVRQEAVEYVVAQYPNVEIVQTVADIATASEGFDKVSDALAANPGVTAIISNAGTASIGIANALADFYATNPDADHIFAATMDQSEEVLNGVRNGQIDFTVAQNGWLMGYGSLLALALLADGWEPVEFGQFIDTGYTFIDQSNVDDWEAAIEQSAFDIIASFEGNFFVRPQ